MSTKNISKINTMAKAKSNDKQKQSLRQEYIDAENDPVNQECLRDWDRIETEGLESDGSNHKYRP